MSDAILRRRLAYMMFMGAGAQETQLIAQGYLSPLLTLTRSQAGGVSSTVLRGGVWSEVAADTARFDDSGLLIGGQRVNLLTNIRTAATESVTVTAAAHTLSFFGTGTITLSGAATDSLVGTGATQRVSLTFTPSAGTLTLTLTGSATWAQLELGSFASTPILPATTGPATRGADLVSGNLTSLGLPANGAGTWLVRVVIPQAAPAGVTQTLLSIDTGADTDRYTLFNSASSTDVRIIRRTANVAQTSGIIGTFTAGTPFSVALANDGAGVSRASVAGGAAAGVTGGPVSGLTTARVGNIVAGTAPLFGSVIRAVYTPVVYTDGQLQAASAAFA